MNIATPRASLSLPAIGKMVGRSLPWVVWVMLAGVLLGDAALGPFIGTKALLATTLFGTTVGSLLTQCGNWGLVLFVFAIGAHFEAPGFIRDIKDAKCAALIAGSIVLPAIAGAAFGALCFLAWGTAFAPNMPVGVVASAILFPATAVPVLASIMHDLRIVDTYRYALIAAVACDFILWPAFSVLTSAPLHAAAFALPLVVALALGMLALGRYLPGAVARLARSRVLAFALCVAFAYLLSTITQAAGFHPILGAFVAGMCMPRPLLHSAMRFLEWVGGVLIVPFFLLPGISLGPVFTSSFALTLAVLYTLAAGGVKYASVWLAARTSGISRMDARIYAALLNTRGTVELAVVTLLAKAGSVTPPVFAAVVIMTMLCTAATGPLVRQAMRASTPA